MFEELFPRHPRAPYRDAAIDAGFRAVDGDAAADPDAGALVSNHGEIINCMIGDYAGRRVAVFENIIGNTDGRSTWMYLAFNIGGHDFRETNTLGSYWNVRRDGDWIYFEASIQMTGWPDFNQFLHDASEIVELYLL